MDHAEAIAGFYAPVHRALTEPILLGGAPRAVAIVNGTLAAAVGARTASVDTRRGDLAGWASRRGLGSEARSRVCGRGAPAPPLPAAPGCVRRRHDEPR